MRGRRILSGVTTEGRRDRAAESQSRSRISRAGAVRTAAEPRPPALCADWRRGIARGQSEAGSRGPGRGGPAPQHCVLTGGGGWRGANQKLGFAGSRRPGPTPDCWVRVSCVLSGPGVAAGEPTGEGRGLGRATGLGVHWGLRGLPGGGAGSAAAAPSSSSPPRPRRPPTSPLPQREDHRNPRRRAVGLGWELGCRPARGLARGQRRRNRRGCVQGALG